MIVIGLISGTAMDGTDAAIVDIGGSPPSLTWQLIHALTVPHPDWLRRELAGITHEEIGTARQISTVNAALGEQFAKVVLTIISEAGLGTKDIGVIGSHGQTIWQDPGAEQPSTLQLGEPTIIAERTGIPVLNNFRSRDIAAGGQGAPLMAYVDSLLFVREEKTLAIQNIGGTGSVTFLPRSTASIGPFGFDTGPGNLLIDNAAARVTQGSWYYDHDGYLSSHGSVSEILLTELLSHPYFERRPPKTTGRELFNKAYMDQLWSRAIELSISPEDIIATLTAFTARSIGDAYKAHFPYFPDEVIVSGGGASNPVLMAMLAQQLSPATVSDSTVLGVPPAAKKAFSFAVLAYESWHNRPANLPRATGAHHKVVLGSITPA